MQRLRLTYFGKSFQVYQLQRKHNGLVHLLHAMLVHACVCEYMKHCLAMVKLWIARIAVLFVIKRNVIWQRLTYVL